jgi:hypothetical protein
MRGPSPRAERFWKTITSQNTAATMDSASKVSPAQRQCRARTLGRI